MRYVRLRVQAVVHDPVLQEDIVCGEGSGPGCCCWRKERHWDAEADFGRHCDGC
jgi:hypothetical protein